MKRHSLIAIALVALVVAAISLPAPAKEVVVEAKTGLTIDQNKTADQARPAERAPTAGENLEVFLFQAPVDASQNEDIAGSMTLHIRNSGTATVPYWVDFRFFLSDDAIIDIDDQTLFADHLGDSLQPGETFIVDFSGYNAVIPYNEEPGSKFIGVFLDPSNLLPETNENDNTASLPITILEDTSKRSVYVEDFQDGDGGWTSEDLTVTTHSWWNQTDYLGRGVMWCGGNDPAWDTGPGYGNSWNERLRKSFALPAGNPAIQYTVQYDTEPGYDFFTLEASADGGLSFTELDSHDGNSGGFVTHVADLTSFAGQDVVIQFRVESDGGWSDEDGLYPTDGAARLDSVSVTGYGTDDFETDNDGWEPFLSPGSSSELYRLEENPYCYSSYNCDEYGSGAKVGESAVTCNAWVAYDPVTLEFPYTPPTESDIRIAITSPVFSLPVDATIYRLEFDVYHRIVNFPGDGVFFGYEVSAPAGTPWQNAGSLYYANNGWNQMSFDVTSFALGASDIQIRLVGRESSAYSTTGVHTEGPYFDNVRLIVAGGSSGGIDDSLFPRACSYQPGDSDGDGVFDVDDGEPTISAVPFDRDGDGVLDDPRGARHIEYWGDTEFPISYVIHEAGSPDVSDGSDLTAVQAAMDAWTVPEGVEVAFDYGGTTTQDDADGMDGVNLVTFSDPDFVFPNGVIAVGISTSFTNTTDFHGTTYRPGQIADVDMIFNPNKAFKTATDGPPDGTDIQAVATHEGGHLLGISHTAVVTSTMFYVLPPGTKASTLEVDDQLSILKAYPDWVTTASGSRLSGSVSDGYSSNPIPGAVVFVIDAVSGDTTASDFTLPDGSFQFIGLPNGDYYVSVFPLNGTSPISFIAPENINDMVFGTVFDAFGPEYWDSAESSTDDPTARTAIAVAAGSPVTGIDVITNVDLIPPEVVAVSPAVDATGVVIDAAVLVSFSEPIDDQTLAGNFSVTDSAGTFMSGNAALLDDDTTLAFIPASTYEFSSTYEVKIDTGLADIFGNQLAAPYTWNFVTEARPAVSVTTLAPSKGGAGSMVAVNGQGMGAGIAQNEVHFDGQPLVPTAASPNQVVFEIPENATLGGKSVAVKNLTTGFTSNSLTFTVLADEEVPRGFDVGSASLVGLPREIAVPPDGSRAFVATDAGLSIVVIDPGAPDFLAHTPIAIPGGLNGVDVTPDGQYVFAVSTVGEKVFRVNADPGNGPLGIVNETDVDFPPRGIVIDPSGRRAYISTGAGRIRVWDTREGSVTYDREIGTIGSPFSSLAGNLAVDPSGSYLFAIGGSGELAAFNLNTDSYQTQVAAGAFPRDVVVDPAGRRAYLADDNGYVTIVRLDTFQKVIDVQTGGQLRAVAVTPGGSYLYAVNRALNTLDVVDLRESSARFRTVTERHDQQTNPLGMEITPDGEYVLTIVESDRSLHVIAVGFGPTISSVTPQAAPVGAKVVIAGTGFAEYNVNAVSFNGTDVAPDRVGATSLSVTIPAGATTGPVRVKGSTAGALPAWSNDLYFELLGPTEPGTLSLTAKIDPPGTTLLAGVMDVSVDGQRLVAGSELGNLLLLDIDGASSGLHQFVLNSSAVPSAVSDAVLSPDRTRSYVLSSAETAIAVINTDEDTDTTGASIGSVALPVAGAERLSMSLDGRYLLASDPNAGSVYVIDVRPGSATEHQVLGTAPVSAGEMTMHPGGEYAYLADTADDPAVVRVLDLRDGTVGALAGSVDLPDGAPDEVPVSLSFSPNGTQCFVLTTQLSGAPNRTIVTLTTTTPSAPAVAGSQPIATSAVPAPERLRVSPRGDRAVVNVGTDGFLYLDVTSAPSIAVINQLPDPVLHSSAIAFDYSSDGSRLYAVSTANDSVYSYDFSGVERTLATVSGDGQTGVSGHVLAKPLSVRVTETVGGGPVKAVAVTFDVTTGSGSLVTDDPLATPTSLVVATDADGYASVQWRVGDPAGTDTQELQASALGLTGSPVTFTASSLVDPETLPLTLAAIKPADQQTGVKVTTGVQAKFSRPVKPITVNESTFFLQNLGTAQPVPTIIGYANGDRQLSITPAAPLDFNTVYAVSVGTGITDAQGGALQNSGVTTFTTSAPPTSLTLSAVSPPSSVPSVDVIISGEGFATVAGDNTVTFNGVEAAVLDADVDFLQVKVPSLATSGDIVVTTSTGTSNPIPFAVLEVETSPVDDVLATIGTGSSTRSVSLTPDGTRAYAVSPDANVVVVIDIDQFRTMASVRVGDGPFALAINPEGTYAYVASIVDGTVSVIDIDPLSPTQHEVVETMVVGTAPTDIAMGPDGDRVLVANAGSQNLSLIDCNEDSETFNQVLATIGVGSSARSVSISPDGGRWYVGTNSGYIVMDALNHAVLATIGVGSTTRSTSITPDGTLLILLTTLGEVFVFDVADGSPSQNQVIATIGRGSSTRTASLSPDGGLLYLVQDEVDVIIVVSMDIFRGVSVGEDASSEALVLTAVDTLTAGENPSYVAFDPSGSGQVLVTNEGDASITVFDDNPVVLNAEVIVSSGDLGPGLSASIELGPSFPPENIDLGSVTLSGSGSVPVLPDHTSVQDSDGDGADELHLYFDRVVFQQVIPQGDDVPVTVSGVMDPVSFSGTDTIPNHPPVVTAPTAGAEVSADASTEVAWVSPPGAASDTVDVFWSYDLGVTWLPIATAIPDTGSVTWDTPDVSEDSCLAMVRLYRAGQVVGMGMTEGSFSVNGSVATALNSATVNAERGAAVLRWKTNRESGAAGFRILRADREGGRYEPLGDDLVEARGSGSSYEFRDETLVPNRFFYYRLVEVEEDGATALLWSGSVMLRLTFALEQNYPNPFNPTTTIAFSIPEQSHVNLVVYDVAGRVVRTLVNETRRANYYNVEWDGRNNHGQQVSSGVYFYKIVAGKHRQTRKMLLLK